MRAWQQHVGIAGPRRRYTSEWHTDDVMNRAALWIVDALGEELAADKTLDRAALVRSLLRRAGYEQADCLVPGDAETVRAALVARLAGRWRGAERSPRQPPLRGLSARCGVRP